MSQRRRGTNAKTSGPSRPVRAAREVVVTFPDGFSFTVKKTGADQLWPCPRCVRFRCSNKDDLKIHAASGVCLPRSARVAAQQSRGVADVVPSAQRLQPQQDSQRLTIFEERVVGQTHFATLVQRFQATQTPSSAETAAPKHATQRAGGENGSSGAPTFTTANNSSNLIVPDSASAKEAGNDDVQMAAQEPVEGMDIDSVVPAVTTAAEPVAQPFLRERRSELTKVHAQDNTTLGTSETKSTLGASSMHSAAQGTQLAPTIVDEPCSDHALTRDFRSLSVVAGSPPPARRPGLAVTFLSKTSSPHTHTHDTIPHATRRSRTAPSVPPPEYPLTPASMRDDTPDNTAGPETQEPRAQSPVRMTGYTRQSLSYSPLPAPPPTALPKAPAAPVVEQPVPAPQSDAAHNALPLPPAIRAFLGLATFRNIPELPTLGAFLVRRGVCCEDGLNCLCTMRPEALAEDLGDHVRSKFDNIVWMALRNGLDIRAKRMELR
ncbi:uncharacterized protein PHACADRAFT_248259 [Phanerochaete carnosa HHB-10118-sp]|uniref:Uncharacterized protein n=1 Tax=Phanerochaete carnosa (strain HHB-10118-sp) TaxID=650164 RepID=K5WQP3_PHACS|nr:uncharacterized protein PHACADRAFT_248259 [Phanerochaete carnosa HHB-10118-sp]EKM61574.1 hypothetical protein PHACADRAFT_248259 [Phanerochaete carnosa HHB-10118-sp]